MINNELLGTMYDAAPVTEENALILGVVLMVC